MNNPRSVSHHSTQRVLGDYELLEEIARGGMGVVYRARQVSLKRIVALKTILFGEFASNEFVRRFRGEAEAAARLQHPNIVAIHDVGEHEGQYFFSMDYVEGRNLADLTREGPLPSARAAGYVQKIAEAIHYAHQRGVLHRDLKPSNVLVDAHDEPRITDFGLAKRLFEPTETVSAGDQATSVPSAAGRLDRLTSTGQVLGSPGFFPPEQVAMKGVSQGPASDVYSLGALLFSLITGRPPFVADSLEAVLAELLHHEPVSPRLLNPGVPKDLETICLKCLEKDPARRYATAQALAEDLSRYLQGSPIKARPLNRLQKLSRWCQRQPALASAIGTALLLLILGIFFVTLAWRRAEREHRLAEENLEIRRRQSYVEDMRRGFAAWYKEGDLATVLEALENQRPHANQTDLRGFEWRHLWWVSHPPGALRVPARGQVAGAMTFSPKGRILAVRYWDNVLRFWNLDSPGKELLVVTNAIALGAFVGDEDHYLVGTGGGSITVRRLSTGELVRSIPADGELVAADPKGQTLATINPQNVLKVWDTATGRLRFTLPGTVPRRSNYSWEGLVAISPSGNLLGVVRPGRVGGFEDSITLWNLKSGEPLPSAAGRSQIRCLTFAPNEKLLALGNGDGSLEVWDFAANKCVPLLGGGLAVLSLAFSPDSKILAAGGADEAIRMWDMDTGSSKPGPFRGPVGLVWSLAFSPDGSFLVSGSRNSALNIWDLRQEPFPDGTGELAKGHGNWANFVFSPDSRLMAAACKGGVIKVWEIKTFQLVASLPGADFVVGFSLESPELLVATGNHVPMWWNFKTATKTPIRDHDTAGVQCVDISPDGRLAALGRDDGKLEILELDSSGKSTAWKAHDAPVRAVRFSPAADKLVSGSQDRSIAVWDVGTRKRLASNEPGEHRGAICSLVYSHDGNMIASGCGADMIKLWKASDLTKAVASMPFHKAPVRTLDFSPDRQTLASGSDDMSVRLFHVPLNDTPLSGEITAMDMSSPVRLVLFSPDGNTLAIVTDGGELKLLRASASLEVADRDVNVH